MHGELFFENNLEWYIKDTIYKIEKDFNSIDGYTIEVANIMYFIKWVLFLNDNDKYRDNVKLYYKQSKHKTKLTEYKDFHDSVDKIIKTVNSNLLKFKYE